MANKQIQQEENYKAKGHGGREVREIRGYPKKRRSLIRNLKRSNLRKGILSKRRPPVHRRPWKYRTRISAAELQEQRAAQTVRGSLQERIFYKALEAHGFQSGIDFTFQSSMMGGRMEFGGLVADFVFPLVKVIVQVQSAWHKMSSANEMRDRDQSILLRNLGYQVLEIWPVDIMDSRRLDDWIQRNVMYLHGTNRQALSATGNWDVPWLQGIITPEWLAHISNSLSEIYWWLTGEGI